MNNLNIFRISSICFLFLFSLLIINSTVAMTTEEERKTGEKIFFELRREVEFVDDLDIQTFINRLGSSLVLHAGHSPFEFRFFVIRSLEPNAFAIPGGYIFLTTGILSLSESEHEVASVVAHEIAHIMGRHIAQLIEKSKGLNIMSLAGIIASILIGGGGKVSEAGATMSMALSEAYRLKYTREMETDADQNSLRYMINAGYDPIGLLGFLKKIYRINLTQTNQIPAYLSTHPAIEQRISLVENLIQVSPKVKGTFKAHTDFNQIKIKAFVEEREPNTLINHFNSLIEKEKNNLDGYYGLGLSYRKIGRLDKSIEVFRSALEIDSEAPHILREIGISYFLSGRLNESIEKLKLSLISENKRRNEENLSTLYYLGRCYLDMGDFTEALKNFLKIKRELPEHSDLLFSLGSTYGRLKEKGLSHFYFAKHFKVKGDKKSSLLHFKKAIEFLEKGSPEREEAQKEIRVLSKTD